MLTANDYRYLYGKLESSNIPECIYTKIMNDDDLTNEEETIIKKIIEKERKETNL